MALTQQTMGRRRRRRRSGSEVDDQLSHLDPGEEGEEGVHVSVKIADIFMFGESQNAL